MKFNITKDNIHSVEKNDTGGDEIYDFKINERKFVLYFDVAGESRLVEDDTDINVVDHGIFDDQNDIIELREILKEIVNEQKKKDINSEVNELLFFFTDL